MTTRSPRSRLVRSSTSDAPPVQPPTPRRPRFPSPDLWGDLFGNGWSAVTLAPDIVDALYPGEMEMYHAYATACSTPPDLQVGLPPDRGHFLSDLLEVSQPLMVALMRVDLRATLLQLAIHSHHHRLTRAAQAGMLSDLILAIDEGRIEGGEWYRERADCGCMIGIAWAAIGADKSQARIYELACEIREAVLGEGQRELFTEAALLGVANYAASDHPNHRYHTKVMGALRLVTQQALSSLM